MNIIFAVATGVMFGIGVFQILRRDMIKSAMGFYIVFTAVNFFFLAAGAFNGVVPPYAGESQDFSQVSDPLVQALILTAIVVSFGSFSLLLGLVNMYSNRFNTVDSDEADRLQN